jgi:hypothetical protein
MVEIFLSYSGADKDHINTIIENLNLTPSQYNLWYYNPNSKVSMDEVLKKRLPETDLFILIVSNNSLSSPNVQEELRRAIELTQKGQIKGLYPILIDSNINVEFDSRIPKYIESRIRPANSPIKAARIIEEITEKY